MMDCLDEVCSARLGCRESRVEMSEERSEVQNLMPMLMMLADFPVH